MVLAEVRARGLTEGEREFMDSGAWVKVIMELRICTEGGEDVQRKNTCRMGSAFIRVAAAIGNCTAGGQEG
jgi:hypothetical protein